MKVELMCAHDDGYCPERVVPLRRISAEIKKKNEKIFRFSTVSLFREGVNPKTTALK
jgi:hypothetical protein